LHSRERTFCDRFSLNKFQEYIDGQKVFLETDNKALSYLNSMKNSSQRLLRRAWKIQEFSPEMKHIPGSSNIVADYLSRNPLSSSEEQEHDEPYMYPPIHQSYLYVLQHLSLKDIQDAQLSDPIIQNLMSKENFRLINSVLYKIILDSCVVPVISKPIIQEVMKVFHNSPEGSHLGISKPYQKMKTRYYFPNLHQRIVEYILSTGELRQLKTTRTYVLTTSLGPLVYNTYGYDGSVYEISTRGFQYIFVIVDYFSKWVEVFPLRKVSYSKLVQLLQSQIFCRYGIPKVVVNDNATYFTSKFLKSTLNLWGIKHSFIPPYTPQVNLTERVNRTIKKIIRSHVLDEKHSKWAECLPFVQMAINSSYQESIKFTPSEAFLSRNMNLSVDNFLESYHASFDKDQYSKLCLSIATNLQAA